ncbi:methyltransferase family protein [Lentibacter sp. XHP0401]|jgi:protein-S-isoprenylcysteine O-methyltransferase Ste14|uniref:methyltransferase family protein n=1 Tax=Lentibacter sp. XHP0401 TaxID=2984334 RepID=UPI0021E8108F|nr:isoprenylcysteine carboxylmethyltransferase family protein [Lentibacter sp. XHP0401]MCV2893988.1 isoprenylcysteine carboxylmethyltransferase family protein [Lentibacter sp. XHP0401]
MQWVDLPPVWLVGFIVLAWLQSAFVPLGLALTFPTAPFGFALIGTGLALMLAAVWQMYRHHTTIVPRWEPHALVTGGVFMLSRNPIYLGDALVLAGFALYWSAIPSLLLVPVFMWLVSWRFIEGEEDKLRKAFPKAFHEYEKETRRWL